MPGWRFLRQQLVQSPHDCSALLILGWGGPRRSAAAWRLLGYWGFGTGVLAIGVFALLPSADKALDKLGVHADGVTTTWLGAAGDPRQA